jgi:hypothetical protein
MFHVEQAHFVTIRRYCFNRSRKEDFYRSILHVHKWMTLFIFMYNTVANSNTKPNKINNWLRGDYSP